jgi:hypothetical protein
MNSFLNDKSGKEAVMTYEQIVEMVRKVFEFADARNIYEHIAFQVNVYGEGEGIFYFEVADRQCCIEPYDYYDRDGLFTTTAKVLKDICEKKCTMRSCIENGKMRFEGDVRKLEVCLGNLKLSYLNQNDKKKDK